MKNILIFFIFTCGLELTISSRILFLIPYGSRSHAIFYRALINGLVRRNHSVRIISNVPIMEEDHKNMIHETQMIEYEKVKLPDLLKMRREGTTHHLIFQLKNIAYPSCENLLKSQDVKDILKKADEKPFDILLTGSLLYECALPIAHILSIPRIVLSSASILPWIENSVGNPIQWSYAPNIYLGYSDHMNFKERLYNSLYSLSAILQRELEFLPELDKIARKHLGSNIPSLSKLDRQVSLILVNYDPSTDYPKPNQPNVIPIGGMHLSLPQSLPADLKSFMNASGSAGVIVFSMGSVIKESQIPIDTIRHIVETFKSIPQHVIWKWNMNSPPVEPMPRNVRLLKWIPQQAVLAHPKVKLFITHGGLGSCLEAVYHGVPIIGMPIFGDQDYNVKRSVHDGSGIFLEFSNLTRNSLLEAINEIVNKNRYKEAMMKRSLVLKDKFINPVDLGVFHVEYVIRHKGASHLRPASLDLAWYQFYMIDVILVIFSCIYISLIVLSKLLIFLYNIISNKMFKGVSIAKQEVKKKQ